MIVSSCLVPAKGFLDMNPQDRIMGEIGLAVTFLEASVELSRQMIPKRRRCPRCSALVKAKRKYCTWDCSVLARRMIDPVKALELRAKGLTSEQMEADIPATGAGIRGAISKWNRACKRLNASSAGSAMVLTAGNIQTGSTA
jgi:hypothetical protein